MKAGPGGSKGGNKEQLKEMLAILNTGPKRPSFLDKPPVTASVGKKQPVNPVVPVLSSASKTMSSKEADQLLGLLQFEHADEPRWDHERHMTPPIVCTHLGQDSDPVLNLVVLGRHMHPYHPPAGLRRAMRQRTWMT